MRLFLRADLACESQESRGLSNTAPESPVGRRTFVQVRPQDAGATRLTGDIGPVTRRLLTLLPTAALAVALLSTPAAAAGGALVAPASVCPHSPLSAPVKAQERAMVCLVNYARTQAGEPALEETAALDESADDKAGDIIGCDSFSHYACGREFTYWMRATGYLSTQCWRAGENLAWGSGGYGTVTAILRAWLRSPTHRANLLGDFTQVGTSLRVGTLEGDRGVHIWAQHFGSHC